MATRKKTTKKKASKPTTRAVTRKPAASGAAVDASSIAVKMQGTLSVFDNEITITSEDLAELKEKGLILNIDDPIVTDGSVLDFAKWVTEKIGAPDWTGSMPEPLISLLSAKVTIERFHIQVKTSVEAFALGVSFDWTDPDSPNGWQIIGDLYLKQFAIDVAKVPDPA